MKYYVKETVDSVSKLYKEAKDFVTKQDKLWQK